MLGIQSNSKVHTTSHKNFEPFVSAAFKNSIKDVIQIHGQKIIHFLALLNRMEF